MNLDKHAREFYVQQISSTPPLTGWVASFDGGVTWVTGEPVPSTNDRWRWLVAGPKYDGSGPTNVTAVVLTAGVTRPLLRALDNPEVPVERGSIIFLT